MSERRTNDRLDSHRWLLALAVGFALATVGFPAVAADNASTTTSWSCDERQDGGAGRCSCTGPTDSLDCQRLFDSGICHGDQDGSKIFAWECSYKTGRCSCKQGGPNAAKAPGVYDSVTPSVGKWVPVEEQETGAKTSPTVDERKRVESVSVDTPPLQKRGLPKASTDR